ncbi:MAG: hypothetical protein AAF206_30700, partial [Bacteroidota bacterium]
MRHLLFVLLTFFSLNLFAQPNRKDATAERMIAQAKRLMQAEDYPQAAELFSDAAARPFHRKTTFSLYMSGLAAYEAGDMIVSDAAFSSLLHDYPDSRYCGDAIYHMALENLRSFDDEFSKVGLDSLLKLRETHPQKSLRKDAEQAIQAYVYERGPLYLLEEMYDQVQMADKILFLEPLCFKMVEAGEGFEARGFYDDFLWNGGLESDFLEELFTYEQQLSGPRREIMQIALFLPMKYEQLPLITLGESTTTLPGGSRQSVELVEGLKMALAEYDTLGQKKLYLRIYDSAVDSIRLANVLDSLRESPPDVIIGDLRKPASQQLSDWAEDMRLPQIVPLSAAQQLVEDRQYTFLAHASVKDHGTRMAEFARDSLHLTKVAVWTDSLGGTEMLASAFIERFDSLGGEIVRIQIDSLDQPTAGKKIEAISRQLFKSYVDGLYVPLLGKEEASGLILSLVDRFARNDIAVMGSPHWWHRYQTIDRGLKDRFEVLFSSSYLPSRDEKPYQDLYQAYLKAYQMPPGTQVVQGYDLGKYLATVLDDYDERRENLAD